MITQSLDQALDYVESKNVTGVLHVVCEDDTRKFIKEFLVDNLRVQPPAQDFDLSQFRVKLVVVGLRKHVSFQPNLPLWPVRDFRNGTCATSVAGGHSNPGRLIAELTDKAHELLGERGARKVEQLSKQYPPNTDPDAFIAACKKLFTPLLDRRIINELFAPLKAEVAGGTPVDASVGQSERFLWTQRIFRELLGERGAHKVEQLALKYPPDTQPERFARACRSVLAKSVGDTRAEQLFGDP